MSVPQPSAPIQDLFRRLAPIRYGSPLRFPRLAGRVLLHGRRDRRALQAQVLQLLDREGLSLDPTVMEAYIHSAVMLHHLQLSGVKVRTMMKPELMTSLAEEVSHVVRADVPGELVDVGVWKGGSSMVMKAVADELGSRRRVVCLDLFDTMDTRVLHTDDPVEDRVIIGALDLARAYFGTEGVCTSVPEIRTGFAEMGVSLDGVDFIQGNLVSDDFPFHRVGDIALLRVDCDFYAATRATLAALFPKMQPGGVLIFDDYFLEGFGERRAVDELRAQLGTTTPMRRVGQSAVWRLETGDSK